MRNRIFTSGSIVKPKNATSKLLINLLIIGILLIAFLLRVYRLADKNIWTDEGFSIWAARLGLWEAAKWTATDVHPPLYYWLLWGWQQITGGSIFTQRFLSVLMGSLTIATIYKAGTIVTRSVKAGALTGLLMAVSAFAIAWSQEIRMYSLGIWLVSLLIGLSVSMWNTSRWQAWLGYVLAAWSVLMTLYISAVVLICLNAAFAMEYLHKRNASQARRWISAQVTVGLAYLPWLLFALPRRPTWSTPGSATPGIFLQFYATLLATGATENIAHYWLPTLLVWGIIIVGLIKIIQKGLNGRNVLLLSLLTWPPVLMFIMMLPIFNYARPLSERYLLPFLPAFYITLAWSVRALRLRFSRISLALSAIVITSAMLTLPRHYTLRHRSDDYLSLNIALQTLVHPNDAVILNTDQDWPTFAANYTGHWYGVPFRSTINEHFAAEFLAPIWERSEAIWLVQTQDALRADPENTLETWLSANSSLANIYRFENVVLFFFARTPERAATSLTPVSAALLQTINQPVTPELRLLSYALPLTHYQTGAHAFVFLNWQRQETQETYFTTTLEISDDEGRIWRIIEQPLEFKTDELLNVYEVVIDANLPDGWYDLSVVSGINRIKFGRLHIEQKITPTALQTGVNLNIHFDQGITLAGYDLALPSSAPGEWLELKLYWQTDQVISQRYKIFVQLLGQTYNANQDNFLWGQHDAEPNNGTEPFPMWATGRIVADTHTFQVQPQAPPGEYQIAVGLYDPLTGERVPVLNEQGQIIDDHIILTMLEIK